ncbi:DNA-3-methyladenine glycosylase 2 family protein [Methyloligella sp. 2.7D]|uniref:DNA-3-methyladenine glycosylase family protein n=1 Tax=unclassified Methyloligella TaxID=2625955 RepID=UPI00157D250B|nr:DNA-3-methyladenine glycosylase 2 family protein [Methyloligella sp. GL2]QKP76512.1 DNA-3-methyladenine glycosylase 2 family protein [Methyloligella sp. GL2]
MRIIETVDDIEEGLAALIACCPHLEKAHNVAGLPPLRRHEAGFSGLARIVTGQQLSTASAAAIWGRLEALITPFEADAFLTISDDTLRSAGLSAGKIATLRGVAEAVSSGALDLDALRDAPEDELREALTALKGVGPWTADIYMMFCLGWADAWSPGDLALQYAAMQALALPERPDPKQMVILAEPWRPWRGVAARLLWSYYAANRKPAA